MEQKRQNLTNKVVLVVEDEPLLLMLAGEIVEDAGFEPILAHNADEAILILEARDDHQHCVHRRADAGFYGWHQARGRDSGQMATDKARRRVRTRNRRK